MGRQGQSEILKNERKKRVLKCSILSMVRYPTCVVHHKEFEFVESASFSCGSESGLLRQCGSGPRIRDQNCGRDLAEWLERLDANAEVATVLGSIPATSDTVESEGRQMKLC